jgi:hypothetical protein
MRYLPNRSAGGNLPSRTYLDKPSLRCRRAALGDFLHEFPCTRCPLVYRQCWLGDQNRGLKWLGDNLSILRIFTNF